LIELYNRSARQRRTYRHIITTVGVVGISLADPTRQWPPEFLQSVGRDLIGLADAARQHLRGGEFRHSQAQADPGF
jgi:hypothetical protein